MSWIESHTSLARHPKTLRLSRSLGVGVPATIGHLHLLWWWALEYTTGGCLAGFEDDELATACLWEGDPTVLRTALTRAGFVDEDDTLHDWGEYAGKLLDQRRRNAEKNRAWRERKRTGEETVTRPTTNESRDRHVTVTQPSPTRSTVQDLTGPSESLTTPVESGPAREADASTPPTTTGEVASGKGNRRVAAVIDALRAEGMTGTLTPKDRQAIQRVAHDPQEVAALYVAIFKGEYGDPYMHDNLSVWLCLEKLPGWRSAQAGYQAPARRNGRPVSGSAAVSAAFEEALRGHGAAGGAGRERRGRRGPGMGDDETGDRVPRQLPG